MPLVPELDIVGRLNEVGRLYVDMCVFNNDGDNACGSCDCASCDDGDNDGASEDGAMVLNLCLFPS